MQFIRLAVDFSLSFLSRNAAGKIRKLEMDAKKNKNDPAEVVSSQESIGTEPVSSQEYYSCEEEWEKMDIEVVNPEGGSCVYPKGRGLVFIFIVHKEREKGSHQDSNTLRVMFDGHLIKAYPNFIKENLSEALEFAKEQCSKADFASLVMYFGAHGGCIGGVAGAQYPPIPYMMDGEGKRFSPKQVIHLFIDQLGQFENKPKLFIIDSCKKVGKNPKLLTEIKEGVPESPRVLQVNLSADVYTINSQLEGHSSKRNSKGTLLLQKLSTAFDNPENRNECISNIMIEVNRMIREEYPGQVAETSSTLTKKFPHTFKDDLKSTEIDREFSLLGETRSKYEDEEGEEEEME